MRSDHMDFVEIYMSVFIKHGATIFTTFIVTDNYWLSTHFGPGRYCTSERMSPLSWWKLTSSWGDARVFITVQCLGCLILYVIFIELYIERGVTEEMV